MNLRGSLIIRAVAVFAVTAISTSLHAAWQRHVIDDSARGADGARLADVNGDALPDFVTGWEEGGLTRVYLHPGRSQVRRRWPAVTVGTSPAVEDAVLVDLDGDGALDVVSSCEGRMRRMNVHWAPLSREQFLKPEAWKTEPFILSADRQMWMFCLPLQIDGRHGVDLVAGGKGDGATIGWFQSPAEPRRLSDWKWHPLREAGWIMSLVASDMDGDGDADIVFSDRKGPRRGCCWLENPGADASSTSRWREHVIGGQAREVMFLEIVDLDHDGLGDVLVCAKPADILFLRRLDKTGKSWGTHVIPMPEQAGRAKAVNAGDIDLDGRLDLVFTCEGAEAPKHGVMWMSCTGSPTNGVWSEHEISGVDGVKHDLVPLVDLDGDGDLDVLTTEETKQLGVIWYENPARTPIRP